MHRSDDRRVIALSAAAIYSGAAFLGLFESLLPGGEAFSVVPAASALVLSTITVLLGPRLPRAALAALGPLGAALIAVAISTTTGYADAAVLYMWPAVWMAFFFGTWGTAFIIGWIGAVHGVALLVLPPEMSNIDRWIDVVVAVLVVAVVVRTLAARNERLVANLEAEARVDPLTGLLNRRGLEERLGAELSRAARDDSALGAVAFDLDHFKQVNDEHGHEIGDRVLAWLGALLREQARGVDVAARVGGEEFVVLLPRADADAAAGYAERVRRAVEALGPATGRGRMGLSESLPLSVSAGVVAATAPIDGGALLAAADQALYAAKRAGRNRTVVGPRYEGAGAVEAAV
jgi:diguanylate cyclase (GGDEF)-like protein